MIPHDLGSRDIQTLSRRGSPRTVEVPYSPREPPEGPRLRVPRTERFENRHW